jgi:hypothetical protein
LLNRWGERLSQDKFSSVYRAAWPHHPGQLTKDRFPLRVQVEYAVDYGYIDLAIFNSQVIRICPVKFHVIGSYFRRTLSGPPEHSLTEVDAHY